MEEAPAPAILPKKNEPPVYGPVYSHGQKSTKKTSVPPILIIIAIGIIAIVGFILFSAGKPKQSVGKPAPTPTTTPSPTPIQTLAPFATQSAFLQFEQAVNALPTTISGTTLSDQTLSPPTVDLSLGFQK